jgi:hypothetical protein
MQLATDLGNLLGSEKFCDLQYDQGAIQKFIESRVKENDMEFTSLLTTMTEAAKLENSDMSPSAKTAHCTQTARVARSYGFIQ